MSIRINGDNTTAAPGIAKGDDTDTGIQFGTDEVSIVTGGTSRIVTGTDISFKNSSGTERVKFEADGAITAPSHPEGYFYGLSSCSGGNGTTHGVVLSDYAYSKGGFSLSSGKVIIPKSGWYRMVFGAESQITNGGYGIRAMRMRPRVNGTTLNWHTDRWHCATTGSTTDNIHYSFTDIYYKQFTANDQVDGIFQVYWGGNRTENVKCIAQFYYLG